MKVVELPWCGRTSFAAVIASVGATVATLGWAVTAHWVLLDIMGLGLTSFVLTGIQVPSIKVMTTSPRA